MHSVVIEPTRSRPQLVVRPLGRGDTEAVLAVFRRLGERSRALRFGGAKPELSCTELAQLAETGPDRHALVAYAEGDPSPIAIARLARSPDDPQSAELAFAVADDYQHVGVGSVLAELLAADARAAGIRYVSAYVSTENRAAVALVRRVAEIVESRYTGGVVELRAALRPTARGAGRRRLRLRPTG